ncbi:MAG: bifunctional precorrin-2 dehydrogenase/sirohydrochlorin ferrochelatase [Candidatus Omnitrophota bacterium]
MRYYPIALNLANKKVLVVGAGKIGKRKINRLLECRAKVKVVSICANKDIRIKAKLKKIVLLRRPYKTSDTKNADLIIAATNNKTLNQRISQLANKKRVLVNVVDDSYLSNFISPAILRREKSIVAVYSDAKDPKLSKDLKNFIEDKWNEFLSYRSGL